MPQKVLIVDDSAAIRALITARLKNEHLELAGADNGNAGLELAREWQPDLILLDVHIPEPDGFEVCRRLKTDNATAHMPIIFLTGAASTEEKIRGLNLGAADYVTKPFEPAELLARVRVSLRTKFLMDLLASRAMLDGLTGLWNRGYFEHRLRVEAASLRRDAQPLACIMCDVDHFKSVNDRFGHPFGDMALRSIANLFARSCRGKDVVCRFGGEEIVVLTPGSDGAGAAILAERLRAGVENLIIGHDGKRVPVTCSFGVAEANLNNVEQLVAAADANLYEAKRNGRNRVVSTAKAASAALPEILPIAPPEFEPLVA